MRGYLVLEDGTSFAGEGFGAARTIAGEVVFNTGMTGYQEVLTDPSYYGQIVTMTYPLIGNYGINVDDVESRSPWIRGFIVRELCDRPSHWQAERTLAEYLAAAGIPGLAGIDTRALTRHLRSHGSLRGVMTTVADDRSVGPETIAAWAAEARQFELHDHVSHVTTPEPYRIAGDGQRVVVIDYGVKRNILRCLAGYGCDITVLPATATAADILACNPDGVLLSNGPGDPTDLTGAITTAKGLLDCGRPLFGICLGHQILTLAMGGRTYKLKYGHRGANHPVVDYRTGRVYITTQNHGYAVDEDSLPAELVVTHRNLNDNTVEGLMHKHRPVCGVQYHPEAAPGPQESRYLFDRFVAEMGG